jgi:hypothetical protein
MKSKLRQITVNHCVFSWRYQPHRRYQHTQNVSRLLIFNHENNICIEVFFHIEASWTGGNPLNEGIPVIKNGQREILNLNKPKFIAELLMLILNSYESHQLTKLVIKDGNRLISQAGYLEAHEEYLHPSFRHIK